MLSEVGIPSLTISAAARHCGVHRRTLQRAIRAGRLRLTPDAQLTIEALTQAGYTAETPQDTPHVPPQTFDTTKYRLGKLCQAGHDWQGTGQSLRVKNKAGYCLACNAAAARDRRQATRQARQASP